jgi:hypothetical protein
MARCDAISLRHDNTGRADREADELHKRDAREQRAHKD